jgi:hypothetical protein
MIDPKEEPLMDSNSSCPRTKQALIDWFDRKGPALDRLLSLIELGEYEKYPDLWNNILDYQLCSDYRFNAWVTRTGKIWTCGFAQHECLLRIMGVDILEAEAAGWLRVTGMPSTLPKINGYIRRRITSKQKRFARDYNVKLSESGQDEPVITTPLIDKYEKWKSL